ncbi:MAG: S4 domain-containing protein [Marinirhabdus sp.]|nr:S4 domain-containing protein [Marinirhabdus sp.]
MSRQENSKKGKPSKTHSAKTTKNVGKGERKGKRDSSKTSSKNKPATSKRPTDGIRLNKYIANSGVCSRREADTFIATGLVSVNGKIVNEMGHKVKRDDDVRFDGRRINPEPDTYVLLNKPKSVATTTSESKGLTVMDLISNATTANVKPIGRLGRNATGLILFTNDDKLVKKLHSKGMERLFHIELDKNLKAADLDKIREGLTIAGEKVFVEEVSYVDNAPKKEVGLKIKNMGNSIIRTIFDHLGYNVVKVDCVTIAHLTKKDLPRGRWKILTKEEVELFSML